MMSLLVGLRVVEGMQHSMHQLILRSNKLLEVDGVVRVVVVPRLVVPLVVLCVHHLIGRWDKSIRFYETHLYAQGVDEKMLPFYLSY
jgi:hypothetical protein